MTKFSCFVLMVLAGSSLIQGAILTVGPDGTYPTIQLAVNNVAVGQTNEIRVEGGGRQYFENVLIPSSFSAGTIELTGGWDTTFSSRDPSPGNTFLDGLDTVRPLDIRLTGGAFTMDGFTVRHGVVFGNGGGIRVWPGGDSVVTLRNLRVTDNLVTDAGQVAGGGIYAELDGNEQLFIEDLRIRDNQAESTGALQVHGGGLFVYMTGSSRVEIDETEIDRNSIESNGGALQGGGLYLVAHENAIAEITYSHLYQNTVIGSSTYSCGAELRTTGSASLTIARGTAAFNSSTGDTAPQIRSIHSGMSSLVIRDSGVAGSDNEGIVVFAVDSAQVHFVNLTVADNFATGIRTDQDDTSTISLYNSISFNNGTDLFSVGTLDMGFNLIGVDPLFANPAELDYHLRPGSPALNAGTNTPPGGLGATDLDGNPRVQDSTVDIGMYEGVAPIFVDGFETGSTDAWSQTVP